MVPLGASRANMYVGSSGCLLFILVRRRVIERQPETTHRSHAGPTNPFRSSRLLPTLAKASVPSICTAAHAHVHLTM